MVGSVACSTGAERAGVPELKAGEVLLYQPYPYRTVTQTARTVYQITRLGFSSVRSFQEAHNLKVDGIIGPVTQRRADAEYVRRFGRPPDGGSKDDVLSVSVQAVGTTTGLTAKVSVRSASREPPRIVGSLKYDEARGFQFAGPSVTLNTKACLRCGGLVGCGVRSVSVALSQGEVSTGTASLPLLRDGESGTLYVGVTYFGADLAERVAKSDVPLPTGRQK